jgi:thiol-disulfide isomerase/thioredoxin
MKYIVTIIIISLFGCNRVEPVRTGFEGKPLPSFKLLLSDSTTYNMVDVKEEKPIILFYYSPDCPYCKAQMEEMIGNIEEFKNTQLYVITDRSYSEMKTFIKKYKLNKYRNIVAGIDINRFIEPYYSLSGVPFTAIYDKNKILKEAYIGKIKSKYISKGLDDSAN